MKRFFFSCALILGLLSAPAFAAKNSQTVNFPDSVTVGSTQLPAGDYKVSWTGTGSNVQVTFQQKGKSHPVTGTATAKLVEANNGHDGFTTNRQGDANVLETLQVGKVNLILAGASAAAQGQ